MRPFVHERSAPAADSAPPARATIPHVRAKIAPQVAESAVRSCAASTRARELPRRDQAFFLNLAIPHLAADLRPSGAQLLWIVDIYGFPLAGFLIAMGTLGDRIGRRRLLMFGAGAFGAALGIAVLGSILTAIYRARMTEAGLPGVPREVIDAARETLGGAVAAAGRIRRMRRKSRRTLPVRA